jgi:hypothetical protein
MGLGGSHRPILKDIAPIAEFCTALKPSRVAAASHAHQH